MDEKKAGFQCLDSENKEVIVTPAVKSSSRAGSPGGEDTVYYLSQAFIQFKRDFLPFCVIYDRGSSPRLEEFHQEG